MSGKARSEKAHKGDRCAQIGYYIDVDGNFYAGEVFKVTLDISKEPQDWGKEELQTIYDLLC